MATELRDFDPGTRPGFHKCPGCDRNVANHLFACLSCWYALPAHLRKRINAGWYGGDSIAHAAAKHDAILWYEAGAPPAST